MVSIVLILAGAAGGAVLGAGFFGGLWWTSRRLVERGRAGLVALSFVARMGVLAGGLIGLALLHPLLLLGSLPGLIAARIGWTRSIRAAVLPGAATAAGQEA